MQHFKCHDILRKYQKHLRICPQDIPWGVRPNYLNANENKCFEMKHITMKFIGFKIIYATKYINIFYL